MAAFLSLFKSIRRRLVVCSLFGGAEGSVPGCLYRFPSLEKPSLGRRARTHTHRGSSGGDRVSRCAFSGGVELCAAPAIYLSIGAELAVKPE